MYRTAAPRTLIVNVTAALAGYTGLAPLQTGPDKSCKGMLMKRTFKTMDANEAVAKVAYR
ncbi:MAG TPA: hypothetical protein VE083_07560 [Terriglobales bacterium]|nr:hypothetical protein [Terriglobales bacterium]